MSAPISARKTAFKAERRTIAKARRMKLLPQRAQVAKAVAAGALPDFGANAVIAGYLPKGDEFDIGPLLSRLKAGGHRIVLPIVVARGAPLIFRQWREGDVFVPGVMGISTPPPHAPQLTPDIVLVPFLEADGHGFRLGYGGGYYDRTLTGLRAAGPVVAIGVGFAGQIVDEVPRDDHDARLDAILTEDGLTEMAVDFAGKQS